MSELTPTEVSEIKKRRWQRLLNTTVVFVGVAFVFGVFHPYSNQMNAIREFKRLGGTFDIDVNAPRKPKWLRDFCDKRGGMPIGYLVFFGRVRGASFHGSDQSATPVLETLSPLDDISKLDLAYVQIARQDLELMQSFPELRTLYLDFVTLTPNALADLDDFQNLTKVSFLHVELTASDFAQLSKLRNLAVLFLEGTPATDAAVERLTTLPHLRVLSLFRTQMTDEGLWELRKCTELKLLIVSDTSVTREGLSRFRNARPDVSVHSSHTPGP